MTVSFAHRLAVVLATIGVVSFTPRTVAAQQADSVARRDSIARRDSVLRAGAVKRNSVQMLAPVEVQASIAPVAGPTIGSGIPARITVLSGHDIDEWEPRILPDVLGTIAGVSIYDDLGSQFKLNVNYRGFNTGPTVGLPPGITVFLDGVRQNEADAQEVDFDLLPMEHVKRVELLSGTASLLGPNSLAGAINLVTDRGEVPPHGELELSGGSFGQVEVEGTVEGKATNGWDYYLGGGFEREDGWREETFGRNFNGFLNLGHFGAERGFGLQAMGAKSRAGTAGSIPESLYGDPQINFTPGDVEDLNMEQLNLTGYVPMGGGRGTLTLFGKRFDADRFNVNQAPDPNVDALTKTYTVGGTADWRRRFPLGANSLSLRFGIDGSANWVHEQIINTPSEVERHRGRRNRRRRAAARPHDGREEPELGSRRLRHRRLQREARDAVGRRALRLHPRAVPESARRERQHDEHLPPLQPARRDQRRRRQRRIALRLRGRKLPRAGDRGARVRRPHGIVSAPLRARRRSTAQARARDDVRGGRQASTRQRVDRCVGVPHRCARRDLLHRVAGIAGVGLLHESRQDAPRGRRALGDELTLAGPLSWYANYAYTRATFESNAQIFSTRSNEDFAGSPLFGPNIVTPGDVMPLVPANQVKGGFAALLPKGFRVGLDARWIGSQYLRGDEGNEERQLDPYFVLGARAGYSYRNWDFSTVVTNVLNNHDPVFGTFNANAGTGQLERFLTPLNARTFTFIIRRSFGNRGSDDDN